MNKQTLEQVAKIVREKMEKDGSGHDWWHIVRVRNLALLLAREESADTYVVELAALLHDIADFKNHAGDTSVGGKVAREILERFAVEGQVIDHVVEIVENISFKGAGEISKMRTLEGQVTQDADRLDAIGAIGIGRVFAYGGSKGRLMYDPDKRPREYKNRMEYVSSDSSSINHFYEKLLLLKDLMNTESAKAIAKERHEYMEQFLKRFLSEWEGEV